MKVVILSLTLALSTFSFAALAGTTRTTAQTFEFRLMGNMSNNDSAILVAVPNNVNPEGMGELEVNLAVNNRMAIGLGSGSVTCSNVVVRCELKPVSFLGRPVDGTQKLQTVDLSSASLKDQTAICSTENKTFRTTFKIVSGGAGYKADCRLLGLPANSLASAEVTVAMRLTMTSND